ncbi:MAG: hypothetical protein H7Y27_06935 [Gemmatimonadaceae bacterium]|nr:hypothetical protein [Chitinophagaceae bacterium]
MKKFLIGFFALVLALGFSAFTAPEQQKESQNWYLFVGNPNNASEVADPYFYERQSTIPNCLPAGVKRCAVKAEQDLSDPLVDIPDLSDPAIDIRNKQ